MKTMRAILHVFIIFRIYRQNRATNTSYKQEMKTWIIELSWWFSLDRYLVDFAKNLSKVDRRYVGLCLTAFRRNELKCRLLTFMPPHHQCSQNLALSWTHVLYLYSLTNKGEPPTLSQLPIATKTLIYNSLYSLNLNNNNIAPKIDILILTLCITIT